MALTIRLLVLATVLVVVLEQVNGHGMMMDPINRSSAWRKGFKVPPNYTDNEHFCGGAVAHFVTNKGKCGECGDNYSLPRPRPNENGGIYGKGVIVQEYKEGQKIDIAVKLTANHRGTFEFSLCPLRHPSDLETEECFQQYPLKLVDGSDKYVVKSFEQHNFVVPVQLPRGVTCKQCVIRWHYRAANSWQMCPNGTAGPHCGNQETFRSCADVTITH